jgi:hypothetical protein
MVVLMGSRLFWDHSANKCHLLHRNDRDFFLGSAVGGGPTHITSRDLGRRLRPDHRRDRGRHVGHGRPERQGLNEMSLASGYASVPVYTAGINLGAFGAGEGVNLIKDATNEAQKVDALSFRAMAKGAKASWTR